MLSTSFTFLSSTVISFLCLQFLSLKISGTGILEKKHRYNFIVEQCLMEKNNRRQYNGNTVKIHFSFEEGRCVLMAAWGHSYYIRPAVIKDPANKPREMSPKVLKMKNVPIAITNIENICPEDMGHSCKIGNMRCPGTLKNQNPQFEEKK